MTYSIILLATSLATAFLPPARAAMIDERAASAREAIATSELRQREVLANIFALDERMKASLKRLSVLDERVRRQEAEALALAREVHELERRSADRGRQMSERLDSLYRRRARADSLGALFSVDSPAQFDQHRRFLKLMVEDDRRRIESFVTGLRTARDRRAKLGRAVRRLVSVRREAREISSSIADARSAKERVVADIRSRRGDELDRLRALRREGAAEDLAFYERRGTLVPPLDQPVARAFGTVRDPKFQFKLMHKGWFYETSTAREVTAVAPGRVAVARVIPGWGSTVIVDHGDHYRSVYACASRIKVREGALVRAGETLASTGRESPLFGPGLYFELRHFADAIDPRNWIKDPDFTVRPAQLGVNR